MTVEVCANALIERLPISSAVKVRNRIFEVIPFLCSFLEAFYYAE